LYLKKMLDLLGCHVVSDKRVQLETSGLLNPVLSWKLSLSMLLRKLWKQRDHRLNVGS